METDELKTKRDAKLKEVLDFLIEPEEPEVSAEGAEQLGLLFKKLANLIKFKQEYNELYEVHTAELSQKIEDLNRKKIPNLMQKIGITKLTYADHDVKLEEKHIGSDKKDNMLKVAKWFKEINYHGSIKTSIELHFPVQYSDELVDLESLNDFQPSEEGNKLTEALFQKIEEIHDLLRLFSNDKDRIASYFMVLKLFLGFSECYSTIKREIAWQTLRSNIKHIYELIQDSDNIKELYDNNKLTDEEIKEIRTMTLDNLKTLCSHFYYTEAVIKGMKVPPTKGNNS
jgi:hypothetical protein